MSNRNEVYTSTHPVIVYLDDEGDWQLNLPVELEGHKDELERLLHKVFAHDTALSRSAQLRNLALAQQMSINWCAKKRRQMDVSF